MPKQRASTLSALVCLLVERLLPDAQQSYVFSNLKACEWYRQYNDVVPDFLRGRPRSVILHCLERQSRSKEYKDEELREEEMEGVFIIQGKDGAQYVVDFGRNSQEQKPSCSCKDWIRWHIPCKHFFAIFRLRAEWGWDALPQSYRESAYLSTDHNATDSYFAQFSTVLPSAEYSPKSSTGPSDSAQATNSSGSTQLNARESPESTSLRQEIPNKVRYYSDSDVLNEYCLYTCTRGYPFQSWPCQQEQRFTS